MKAMNPAHAEVVLSSIMRSPFLQMLGIKPVEMGDGVYRSRMVVEHGNLNSFGGIHGGVFAAMLDSACYYAGYSSVPEGSGCITADLQLNYLRAAREGDVLTCEATLIKAGRTFIVTQGTIFDQEGHIMAHATSKLYVSDVLQTIDAAMENAQIEVELPPKFIDVD